MTSEEYASKREVAELRDEVEALRAKVSDMREARQHKTVPRLYQAAGGGGR